MSVDVKLNKAQKRAVITVRLDTNEQIEKEGLTKEVILNHLLTMASQECAEAAESAMSPPSDDDVDAEAAKEKAEIDARAARTKRRTTHDL
jgi:hypothetical protein